MGKKLKPLEDCQIRKGCYHPAHCTTIKWRTGWVRGFVQKWNKRMPERSVDDHFKCEEEDGWRKGMEAGKRDRDPNNTMPRYPYREGEGKDLEKCITPFRIAWRIGWFQGYYCSRAGDVRTSGKLGWGSKYGKCAAERYFSLTSPA